MEIYLILCISFTIMYWWNYTREIIKTVQGVENKFNDIEDRLSPSRYATRMLLLSFLLAPWYLVAIATMPKWTYIKMKATCLVRQQYSLPVPTED